MSKKKFECDRCHSNVDWLYEVDTQYNDNVYCLCEQCYKEYKSLMYDVGSKFFNGDGKDVLLINAPDLLLEDKIKFYQARTGATIDSIARGAGLSRWTVMDAKSGKEVKQSTGKLILVDGMHYQDYMARIAEELFAKAVTSTLNKSGGYFD